MIARDKILPFALLFSGMVAVTLYFWMTSRYPDLGAKAALGGTAPLSGLGFAPLYDIKDDAPLWEKLLYGTINWLETNRRGMTFAFILGAFFLSMLPLLNYRRAKTAIGNAFIGLLMGTPLGLCVNCSAPVARAMQASGMRIEAALALLISSPTMNVVVLTMAFTFFPLYLVLGKIAFTLVFVLAVIPLACQTIFKQEALRQESVIKDCDEAVCKTPEIKGWFHAILWCFTTYVRNFIRIVITTGPLMVLAGLIGTALINFMPWASVQGLEKTLSDPLTAGGIMVGIAFIGALLPAPMAFDVAMSAFLLQAGVPMIYVAVFLFTLGAYSVYAFFIVWQAVSLRMAMFLLFITMVMGLLLGTLAHQFEQYYLVGAEKHLEQAAHDPNDPDPIIPRTDQALPYEKIKSKAARFEVPYAFVMKTGALTVEKRPFVTENQTIQEPVPFTRIYGDELGIIQPYRLSYLAGVDDIPRITTSVASGDVHNDGWEDFLILGDHEVSPNVILYASVKGKTFLRQEIPAAQGAILVALADLDGDGWSDIIYTTYGGKNFVIYNDKGSFLEVNQKPLGDHLEGMTNSIGFGDLDRDGVLEIFLGNWYAGPFFIDLAQSRDMILHRAGQGYKTTVLPGLSGETLASLLWDFDGDGNLDVYIGNDYIVNDFSDLVLVGDGKGGFDYAPQSFIKSFPGAQSTMSLDIGDIDNDLVPEYYTGHIAFLGNYIRKMSEISKRQIRPDEFCVREGVPQDRISLCEEEIAFKQALAKVHHAVVDSCVYLKNETHRRMCELHLRDFGRFCAGHSAAYSVNKALLDETTRYRAFCKKLQDSTNLAPMSIDVPTATRAHHLTTANASRSNILLKKNQDGHYMDIAAERGVAYGGWTWNAKFADLDNDGWQDLYVTNGYSTTMSLGTKVFYRNKGEGYFEDATVAYGLEDFSVTSSYSYVDYDHDGDLDILAVPLDGPVKIFRNNAGSKNKSLQVELRDQTSRNSAAIGAVITIGQQMQIIKGSGGYKSFDPPVAHFGFGQGEAITQIDITWPNGQKDSVTGAFKAGARYRITRQP